MSRGAWRMRAMLVVLAGALAVHELRYRLPGVAPDHASHGYLAWAQLAVGVLVVAAIAELGIRVRRMLHGGRTAPDAAPRFRVLWPVLSAALLVVVGAQETVELRWLGHHDHHGAQLLQALLAEGGWLVVPLAVVLGAACAATLRGAAALVRVLGSRVVRRRLAPSVVGVRAAAGWRPVGGALARRLAGRGPPLHVVVS